MKRVKMLIFYCLYPRAGNRLRHVVGLLQSALVALAQMLPVPEDLLQLDEVQPIGGRELMHSDNVAPDLARLLHIAEPVRLKVGIVLQHLALGVTLHSGLREGNRSS